MAERKKGHVRWFDSKKGYGFIDLDDGSGSVFIHYSEIQQSGFKSLDKGEAVEFEIQTTPRGPKATKVAKL